MPWQADLAAGQDMEVMVRWPVEAPSLSVVDRREEELQDRRRRMTRWAYGTLGAGIASVVTPAARRGARSAPVRAGLAPGQPNSLIGDGMRLPSRASESKPSPRTRSSPRSRSSR